MTNLTLTLALTIGTLLSVAAPASAQEVKNFPVRGFISIVPPSPEYFNSIDHNNVMIYGDTLVDGPPPFYTSYYKFDGTKVPLRTDVPRALAIEYALHTARAFVSVMGCKSALLVNQPADSHPYIIYYLLNDIAAKKTSRIQCR